MTRNRKYDNDPIVVGDAVKGDPIVYTYVDADGIALYVGVSRNYPQRVRSHRQSDWWPLAARVYLVHFPTYDAAMAAEPEFIHEHDPLFNKAHKPRPAFGDKFCITCQWSFRDGYWSDCEPGSIDASIPDPDLPHPRAVKQAMYDALFGALSCAV